MLLSVDDYVNGILRQDISVLAKAITLIESDNPKHQQVAEQVLNTIIPYTGKSFRLGITGSPGVGKSSFIEAFGLYSVNKGHKLAVLAIDPSSSISKGSILGDKTRMENLSKHPKVFIRPSANRGVLGGVAGKTYETMLLCEAAGYDYIFIETVGVGQSEIEVAEITDFFLLLIMPTSGDEIQGIKRGIMEMADGIIITKCDGDNISKAKLAAAQFKSALHYFNHNLSSWIVPVIPTSSYTKYGLDEVYKMLNDYQELAKQTNYIQKKREEQQQHRFKKIIANYLLEDFFSNKNIHEKIKTLPKNAFYFPQKIAKELIKEFKDNE